MVLAKRVFDEARRSPTASELPVAAAFMGLGALSGLPGRPAFVLGCSVAAVRRNNKAAARALTREIESAANAAALARLCPADTFFGGYAVAPDLARLLVEEFTRKPRFLVECGSGSSTVLMASLLQQSTGGKLLALENNPWWARSVRERLDAAGLHAYADVVDAPLVKQRFGSRDVVWYDTEALTGLLCSPVDLLLVDGPPSTGVWARWPALETFRPHLSPDATVLLDDGRRRSERLTAFRWAREHDLDVYWIDTVKGTWKLVQGSGKSRSRATRAALALRRALHPRPPGFGLGAIRR